MSQKSIFGRITQLARANINSMLDQAEDPQMMLDQLVRDYTNNIAEAESAVAQTIGSLRQLEEDSQESERAAADWGGKAGAASRKADELRGSGNTAEADKFDNLARVALERQLSGEKNVQSLAPTIRAQTETVDKLKAGLDGMRQKLEELRRKRDELLGRAKVAKAQATVQDAVKNIDVLDPTSEVSRFEEKIRREEARVRGQAELAESSLDSQFERLAGTDADAEVEARLAALKAAPVG
ncbi:MAG: PspA/IM30 family protein [Natronosporangium sp.]